MGRLGLSAGIYRKPFDMIKRLDLLMQLEQKQKSRSTTGSETDDLVGLLEQMKQAVRLAVSTAARSPVQAEAIGTIFHTARLIVARHNARLEELCRSVDNKGGDRVLRELKALANYWRVLRDLTSPKNHQRELFQNTELNVLVLPKSVLADASQKSVHAEIQILIHFELHPENRPRFIQASKKPCVLCHSFMREHGFHDVPQSHGSVYWNWTVPEIAQSANAARSKLNLALQGVATDLSIEVGRCKVASRKGIYQQIQETVSKLLLDDKVSLSASSASLAGSSLDGENTGTTTPRPNASEVTVDYVGTQPTDRDGTHLEVCKRDSIHPIDSGRASVASTTCSLDSAPSCESSVLECIVSARQPRDLRIHELELFLELEDAPNCEGHSPKATVLIKEATSAPAENLTIVDVDELITGETTVARAFEDEGSRFVLKHGGRDYLANVVWA
jgi:hypothetical protein